MVNCLFVLATAALDSTSELSNPLDTWQKEDQDNVSPVKTLQGLVKCNSSRIFGKISAQPPTILKQICFPNGNVLFLSLFSLSKN